MTKCIFSLFIWWECNQLTFVVQNFEMHFYEEKTQLWSYADFVIDPFDWNSVVKSFSICEAVWGTSKIFWLGWQVFEEYIQTFNKKWSTNMKERQLKLWVEGEHSWETESKKSERQGEKAQVSPSYKIENIQILQILQNTKYSIICFRC